MLFVQVGYRKKVAEKVEDPVEDWVVAPCLPGKIEKIIVNACLLKKIGKTSVVPAKMSICNENAKRALLVQSMFATATTV